MRSGRTPATAPPFDIVRSPDDQALVSREPYRFGELAALAHAVEGWAGQASPCQHFGKRQKIDGHGIPPDGVGLRLVVHVSQLSHLVQLNLRSCGGCRRTVVRYRLRRDPSCLSYAVQKAATCAARKMNVLEALHYTVQGLDPASEWCYPEALSKMCLLRTSIAWKGEIPQPLRLILTLRPSKLASPVRNDAQVFAEAPCCFCMVRTQRRWAFCKGCRETYRCCGLWHTVDDCAAEAVEEILISLIRVSPARTNCHKRCTRK